MEKPKTISIVSQEYLNGTSMATLARKYEVDYTKIRGILINDGVTIRSLKEAHKLAHREDDGVYCPTANEIAKATAEIREGWSVSEEARRAGREYTPVEVAIIGCTAGPRRVNKNRDS